MFPENESWELIKNSKRHVSRSGEIDSRVQLKSEIGRRVFSRSRKSSGEWERSVNAKEWERCRRILYAGRPDPPRSVRLDSRAWSKCWRRCLPRVPETGIKPIGRRTAEAELPTAVRRREDVDQRQGLRVLVFPARIRVSVVEPPLKVIIPFCLQSSSEFL